MSSPDLLPAGSVVAGHRIEEVVGRGATAVVYRATSPDRSGPVALKLIAMAPHRGDEGQERFQREARLAVAVVHRGILPVYEVGEHEGRSFVAMKLAPGDLAALLRSEGRLEPGRAVALVSQLASALDAAHAHGLVHRDVKPSNVLLEEDEGEERAYLADFGVARATFSDRDLLPGELVGTAGYVSPEQIRGESVDRRTDVYALGCLLHECLTGRVPFASRDALMMLWGHLHDDPPQPSVLVPDLPRALDEVVGRALAKRPEARFASAGELSEAARAALDRRPSQPKNAAQVSGADARNTIPASSFLGREEELREADSLLQRTRLVTIAGPGGAGKTRFALELARRARAERFADYVDGVFSCFLSSLRDPDFVVPTIATTLSMPEQPGKSAVEAVSSQIGTRRMLLLLDNLEHLLPAATALAQLLAACPSLTLLVTSRERLQVAAEAAYELPPLTPGESVALFCNRAACKPSEPIADLCSRLEGLPLAIELAAARTSLLSPAELLERLSSRLDLLRSDDRDADPRHRTLRATISWSHELLSPSEQRLLARLSVFRGGATLDAAEHVARAQPDVLQSLVDKNLLRRTGDRFWMLETIREYAAERLDSSAEAGELGRRHAEHFLALAVEAEPNLRGGESSGEWVQRLEEEQDNLRAALDWLETAGERQLGLRLAGALAQFWYLAGQVVEGAHRLAHVLRASHECTPARAKALRGEAVLALAGGDAAKGRLHAEEALAVYRELNDGRGIAHAGFLLGHAAADEEALPEAELHFEESVRGFRELGDEHYTLLATYNLAEVIALQGDLGRARASHERNLADARRLSEQRIVALSLIQLASINADEGRLEDALSMVAEALEIFHGLGDRTEIVDALSRFASILALRGRVETTAALLACSEALRDQIGSASLSLTAKRNEETHVAIRSQLDEAALADAWEQGQALTIGEAVALARESSISEPEPTSRDARNTPP